MAADPATEIAARIERWFQAGLAAVEPEAAVRRHLARDGRALVVDGERFPVAGRLYVVGAGKAAIGMARGVEAVCGDLIATGLVVTKDGHVTGPPLARVAVAEAAHPVPDERGVVATRRMLDLLRRAGPDDVVIALISGGGSALLTAPRPPVSLADMAATTDLLLRAGAPIQELNAVRTPLSLVKGGGLLRAAGTTTITLVLSDVLGNDPRVIASGPTVPATTTAADALAVLDRYRLRERVPPVVLATLRATDQELAAGAPEHRPLVIVGDNAAAIAAMADAIAADGFRPCVVWEDAEAEAADLGRAWVEQCRRAPHDCDVLLGGGEATVTVRGDGIGGRNTEFALAAALALEQEEAPGWVVASLATDGQDGPTDVAGAIADASTVRRARAARVDPIAALANNDSLRVFESAGGLVRPGPTGTNVNDVYVGVRR